MKLTRLEVEEKIKNGMIYNQTDDCVDGFRYCRECGKWLSKNQVRNHMINIHKLDGFKGYVFKHHQTIKAENPKSCPYCNSGRLVGLFTSAKGGNLTKCCGETKNCRINLNSKQFSDLWNNKDWVKSKSISQSRYMSNQFSDPTSVYNQEPYLTKLSNNKIKEHADPNSNYNKSSKLLRWRIHHGGNIARLSNIKYQSKSEKMFLYIGTSKINSNVLKVGISSTNSGRLEDISTTFYINYKILLSNKLASEIEYNVLDQTREFLYLGSDRLNLLNNNSGVSELRIIESLQEIHNILGSYGLYSEDIYGNIFS